MPPEAAAAFTAPLPPEGAVSLVHLAPVPELAYALSKLGVRALVKREAKSLGARGVRIVSISPGAIDTLFSTSSEPNGSRAMRNLAGVSSMPRPA